MQASVTITQVENSPPPIVGSSCLAQPITNLCWSLECSNGQLCGFIAEEDYRYYVYQEPATLGRSRSPSSITLEGLLRKDGLPCPSRRQRYALAFILSSSFLQLLESPWLSATWRKSDVVFFEDPAQPGAFKLDEPHLDNCLLRRSEPSPPTETSRRMQLSSSLEILGVVLLELCFGKLLEEQPCRLKYSNTMDNTIERALDIQAAREWHGDIEEEAGYDYSVAVGWCLGGILSTPPDRWRETMLSKVVQSLESCHKYLQ